MLARLTVVVLLCLLFPADVQAQNQAPHQEKNWSAGISLGAGERSNPLVNGDPIELWWSLDLAWYGKRWFFDNGDLGFTLSDRSAYTVNWVARVNTERAFFSELNEGLFRNLVPVGAADPPDFAGAPAPPQGVDGDEPVFEPDGGDQERTETTIPDRDYALESGFEFLREDRFGLFQAQLLADVSSVHKGYELWLNYSTDFVLQRWHFVPSVSLNWKSRQLNDYYFGVRANEAVGGLSEYEASSGLNASIKLAARYYISEHWTLAVVADYERINSSASNSPLLKDNHITSYFAGVHYAF